VRPAPGSDALNGFTVLRALDGKRLAKVIRQDGDGPVEISDFDKAYEFTATPASVLTLHDLYHQLAELQDDPHACIVRGAIAEGANPARMRRLAHEKTDAAPTLVDVPRTIGSFDFEPEMTEEEARRVQVVADPDGAVDFALGLCPEAFRQCDFVWSFGSSAGIKTTKLSLHFTLMTDRPVLGYELKAIVEKWNADAGRPLFDSSIYGAQSVVYTARPIFEGDAIDPLEDCRIGYRNGTGRTLSLPRPEGETPPATPTIETPGAPEDVALALQAELVARAAVEMMTGTKTRQDIVVGVFTQLRDCRVRAGLALGAARALHRVGNAPDVLRVHGDRRKPLSWFLEAQGSIYGTAPRDPRYDAADAIGAEWPGGAAIGDPRRLIAPCVLFTEFLERKSVTVPCALPALSRALGGGFETRRNTAVVAPAGHGKTAFVVQNVAHAVTVGDFYGVLALRDGDQWTDGLRLAQMAGVDRFRLRDREQEAIEQARVTMARFDARLMFYDVLAKGATFEDMIGKALKWADGRAPLVIGTDSVHVMPVSDPAKEASLSLYERIGYRFETMHTLLVRHDAAGITASQAGRDGYKRKNAADNADELAAISGGHVAENTVDVQLNIGKPTAEGIRWLIIPKSRLEGQGERIPLRYDPARSLWTEAENVVEEEGEDTRTASRTKARTEARAEVLRKKKERVGAYLRKARGGRTVKEIADDTGFRREWIADVIAEFHAAGTLRMETEERKDRRGRPDPVRVWVYQSGGEE